ncbi:MAG: ARMT1-like domain-containing protein [Anaerolineae bacterium]|nr:ARMT1-like domain-containing protein [Anaerolineae bacterium]
MRTDLRCPACIIDDLRGALADCVPDEALRRQILGQALEWLASALDYDRIPSYFITRVHRLLKERAGLAMPFRELRRRCNESGLRLAPVVQARATNTPDDLERFRLLVQWAIAGNHLDFRTVGTGYDLAPEAIEKALEGVLSEGLAIDDTPRLLELVRRGPDVLYLADNVGEIALDALLIAELQRHGCTVTVAVKGGPITSDATIEDARAVGLDCLAPVILTGPDTLGIPIDEEMSPELRGALMHSDLVIGKGQANYYALSELAPTLPGRVACLLRTKCLPAAAGLGLSVPRANVAAILTRPAPGP